MSHYKPYSSYKDSGVEWLGHIPEHWEVKRLKNVALARNSNVDKKSYANEQNVQLCNYTDVYYNERITDSINFMKATAKREDIVRFALKSDDVIITKDSESPDDIGIPALVAESATGVICGYHLTLIRPLNVIFGEYLFRTLCSSPSSTQFYLGASGVTRYGLGKGAIDGLRLSVPPHSEQQAIAAFLDRETARIDALIEKKLRQIELLKEKRQAIITQAVTKGLDPDVPMKDSGVEWLGMVPEHWKSYQVRHLVYMWGGGTPSKSNLSYWDGNIPWVSPKDMKADYISDAQDKITAIAVKESSTKLIPLDSILVVVRGMILIHSVPVALTKTELTINQDMKALVPNKQISCEYLLMLLKGLKDRILSIVDKSAHGTCVLPTEDFMRLLVVIPNLMEQNKIVQDVNCSINHMDSFIEKTNHSIDLLKERRSALITAAVTGQIDVRGE